MLWTNKPKVKIRIKNETLEGFTVGLFWLIFILCMLFFF